MKLLKIKFSIHCQNCATSLLIVKNFVYLKFFKLNGYVCQYIFIQILTFEYAITRWGIKNTGSDITGSDLNKKQEIVLQKVTLRGQEDRK